MGTRTLPGVEGKAVKPSGRAVSKPEALLSLQLRATKIEPPATEYMFHPERRWRFDFAWPSRRIAVEIEGGIATGGRHVRPAGFREDTVKYNEATLAGWHLLRVLPEDVKSGRALLLIERALATFPLEPAARD